MKLKNIHFLSKSNIKGNNNSGTITLLICMLVISVTLISCFAETLIESVRVYENDYRSRAYFLTGWAKSLTNEALSTIENLEHVEVLADCSGVDEGNAYNVTDIEDEEIKRQIELKGSRIYISRLHEKEKRRIIKGKDLAETADFTCLIPHIFYPYDDADDENIDYLDGRDFIGKTITLTGFNDRLSMLYDTANETSIQHEIKLKSPSFTFKVVGTYYCSYEGYGTYNVLYVSDETFKQMTEMAMVESNIDLDSETDIVAKWWKTPSLHYHFVVVDDNENMTEVFNKISKDMGYNISSIPENIPDDTIMLLSAIFKTVGTFLTLSILFISVILLIQSSVNSIRERKGFIGLMKAIGYKNHQIFFSLIYEQLYMTMRAFLIGGAISTLVVFFANLKFEHGTFRQMQYIISWNTFGFFLLIAFLTAFLVPLITQLILLKKLTKIQPREAMSVK